MKVCALSPKLRSSILKDDIIFALGKEVIRKGEEIVVILHDNEDVEAEFRNRRCRSGQGCGFEASQ